MVGFYITPAGAFQGFTVTIVPEPSTLALSVAGALLCMARGFLKHRARLQSKTDGT